MKFKDFLKDKIITTILLLLAILTIEIFLIAYPIANFIRIYIAIITLGLYIIGIAIEYLVKKQFYKNLIMTLEELEDKYLITEIVKSPNFIEGKILNNSLEQINKSMIENVNKYKYMLEDYKEYIELWIHEIKMPIATSKMIIENNKNEVTKSIDEEIEKIEKLYRTSLILCTKQYSRKRLLYKKNKSSRYCKWKHKEKQKYINNRKNIFRYSWPRERSKHRQQMDSIYIKPNYTK